MSTKYIGTALGVVFFCLNALCPAAALAQEADTGGSPCLPHAKADGTWVDNGNGKEVRIKVILNAKDDPLHGRIVARYTEKDKVCRHDDINGVNVPFQTDFAAAYDAGKITGSLFYCLQSRREDDPDKSGKPIYTISVSNATLELTESKDSSTLTGTFKGYNGVESITFTRTSKKPDPNQDYQLTHDEVYKAVFNALHSHGITVPEIFQNRPDIFTGSNKGMGVAIPVVYNSKDAGPAPLIVLLGIEALLPCKTINVRIQILQQGTQANGKPLRDLIPNAGGTGQGDFSSDGLSSAINKAFDQANVNQYMPTKPPS